MWERGLGCVGDEDTWTWTLRRAYLLLALGGTGVLIGHDLLLHHAKEALLRLRVEGHGAFGQLLDAHGVVPLSRQHVLATTGLLLIHHQQITTRISEEDGGGREKAKQPKFFFFCFFFDKQDLQAQQWTPLRRKCAAGSPPGPRWSGRTSWRPGPRTWWSRSRRVWRRSRPGGRGIALRFSHKYRQPFKHNIL